MSDPFPMDYSGPLTHEALIAALEALSAGATPHQGFARAGLRVDGRLIAEAVGRLRLRREEESFAVFLAVSEGDGVAHPKHPTWVLFTIEHRRLRSAHLRSLDGRDYFVFTLALDGCELEISEL